MPQFLAAHVSARNCTIPSDAARRMAYVRERSRVLLVSMLAKDLRHFVSP